MANISKVKQAHRKPEFAARGNTRCQMCGRSQAVYRKFGLCCICFRDIGE